MHIIWVILTEIFIQTQENDNNTGRTEFDHGAQTDALRTLICTYNATINLLTKDREKEEISLMNQIYR